MFDMDSAQVNHLLKAVALATHQIKRTLLKHLDPEQAAADSEDQSIEDGIANSSAVSLQ